MEVTIRRAKKEDCQRLLELIDELAQFEKAPEQLYPNLTAEANIIIQTKEKTLTIPRNYLVQDSFVLLENKEKRKVVTGLKDYKKVEILEGISATDKLLDPLK